MKKFLSGKKGVLVLVLVLVLCVAGFLYNQQQQQLQPIVYSEGYVYEFEPFEIDVMGETVLVDAEPFETSILYEVKVELEDLNLYSQFPSFWNNIGAEENEPLDVQNYISSGWDGMLRGVLVSVDPTLEFFAPGDILMVRTDASELALTVPGDVVTFYCELELVPVLEILKLESCALVKINH